MGFLRKIIIAGTIISLSFLTVFAVTTMIINISELIQTEEPDDKWGHYKSDGYTPYCLSKIKTIKDGVAVYLFYDRGVCNI